MTTITTAKLREIAHTLGTTPDELAGTIWACHRVTIDDAPADTEKQTMAMTITQEQFERFTAIRAEYGSEKALAGIGVIIAPPEPPEAMVKLASDAVKAEGPVGDWQTWQAGYIAAMQHAVKVVKDAPTVQIGEAVYVPLSLVLTAMGAP